METTVSVFDAFKKSLRVALRNVGSLLVLAAVLAIPGALVSEGAMKWFETLFTSTLPARGMVVDPQQSVILALAAADVPGLLVSCLFAAFVVPAVYRIYLQDAAGQSATLGDAFNFGLLRWRQVVWPYTAATLVIWVGSIVVIPGVLYTLYFAFVVAVAAFDPKVKRPLQRSIKLTRGRRGRIFRTYLIFLPWWGWYGTIGPLVLMEQPVWVRLLAEVGNEFIGFILALCFLQFYQERMAQIERQIQERGAES